MLTRSYQITIPEEKLDSDFGIRFLGINKNKAPGLVTNHCGIPALFFLQLQTPGIINGNITNKQATIIWLPDETHSFGSENSTWTHSWIKFLGKKSITIFAEYNIPIGKPFYLKKSFLFEKYATLILEEIRPHITPDIRIIENIYRSFLIEIERDLLDNLKNSTIPENIQKAKDLIDTQYYKNLTLQKLSKECNLASNYLTTEFKTFYGLSIINYLIQVRIFHAKTLLGNFKLNISEISTEVGYSDLQHFSKLFKKHVGMNPTEYRKQIKNSNIN